MPESKLNTLSAILAVLLLVLASVDQALQSEGLHSLHTIMLSLSRQISSIVSHLQGMPEVCSRHTLALTELIGLGKRFMPGSLYTDQLVSENQITCGWSLSQ